MNVHNLHNKFKTNAFTLVEMMIVLLVMWIILMMTMAFSGTQIQKLENKSVKESILAEWQSRYSRNLWSSSYEGNIYDSMTIGLESGSNQISFFYDLRWKEDNFTWSFSNQFVIKNILMHPNGKSSEFHNTWNINIKYTPYRMYCNWWDDDSNELAIIMTINETEDYCFEINKNNCRLIEVNCNPSWYTVD